MDDVVFIGAPREAELFRVAGIASFAPPLGLLAERVMAERRRYSILAMTESTFAALPGPLARELREGAYPQVTILPDLDAGQDMAGIRDLLRRSLEDDRAARA